MSSRKTHVGTAADGTGYAESHVVHRHDHDGGRIGRNTVDRVPKDFSFARDNFY
jgi:hypothetical protein